MKTVSNKAVLFAALISFVAGCVDSEAQREADRQAHYDLMDSWRGHSAQALIDGWGSPTITFAAPNGNTVYQYHKQRQVTDPSQVNQNGVLMGGETVMMTCDTTFEISKSTNRVVTWSSRGNDCY